MFSEWLIGSVCRIREFLSLCQYLDRSNETKSTTGSLKIGDACPGAAYFMQQNNTENIVSSVNVSDCYFFDEVYPANGGVIHGICGGSTMYCALHVKVTQGTYLLAHVRKLRFWCDFEHWVTRLLLVDPMHNEYCVECAVHSHEDMFFYSLENAMWIEHLNKPMTEIDFKEMKKHDLVMQYATKYSGYAIVAGEAHEFYLTGELNFDYNCVIMISVQQSDRLQACSRGSTFQVIYKKHQTSREHNAHLCTERSMPASVFLTSSLRLLVDHVFFDTIFLKISFSAFFEKDYPHKVLSGLFNCSVNHYSKFRQILHCNLKTECENGQDETEQCPFSSARCQGMVASTNKCFKLTISDTAADMLHLDIRCEKMGLRMASIRTRQEQEDALHILKNYFRFEVALAYISGWHIVPFTYSKFRYWFDKTIIYFMNHFMFDHFSLYRPSRGTQFGYWSSQGLSQSRYKDAALCEMKLQVLGAFQPKVVHTPAQAVVSIFTNTHQYLLMCTHSVITHTFMCSPNSHRQKGCCSQLIVPPSVYDEWNKTLASIARHLKSTHVATFSCHDDVTKLHYTLVCDFRQDCPDNSDESLCVHLKCYVFLGRNGQCILNSQRCNEYSDCVDDSDEIGCQQRRMTCAFCTDVVRVKKLQQFYINLDGTGYFTQQEMKTGDLCPETHYHCTSEWSYCLPVYTRCNGISDCLYGQDEQDCDDVHCLNVYNCRDSSICVHGDHLCDGWGQCPRQDDELLCDMTCPEGCLCQGHSLLCRNEFPANQFSQLRYVDAAETRMSLSDFTINIYLMYLDLSSCSVANISEMKLSNLQCIDLTGNALKSVDITMLLHLSNLRILRLAKNPLRSPTVNKLTKHIHYSLMRLDLSKTNLHALSDELSVYLPLIKFYNISFSAIKVIGSVGFKNMPHLREIDARFSPIEEFPLDLFSGSHHLQNILSSNHRFCCENLLPKQSGKMKCTAPKAVLSSCKKLMPTEMYRVFYWVLSVCATLGNLFCVINVLAVRDVFNSDSVTIANLIFAKFCTGCHASMVLVASEVFGIHYIHFEKTWTRSGSCKMAGFLFYLSCETSVLIFGFMTIHHVIAFCFISDAWRLKKMSLSFVVPVAWCTGALLSLMPFLPGLSHWGLHGQSGLCRLALFDRYGSDQEFKWFTVAVAVNVVICFAITLGQVALYKRTPKFRVTLDPSRSSIYSSVHLTRHLVTTDIVSWLSFGFVTIMARNGVPSLKKTHDAMVVFVLPLSSASDPFIYLLTMVMQRRQQSLEEKVVKALKSRLALSGKED